MSDDRERIESALKFDERIWRAYMLLKPIHKDGLIDAICAAFLSPEEIEAVRWLRKHLTVMQMEGVPMRGAKRAAIAVLDRLLQGAER